MQNLKLLFAVIGGTLLLILGASWFFSWQTQSTLEKAEQTVEENRLVPADAHVRGASESAQFTIVEFSDFQCPACMSVSSSVKSLVEEYKDTTRLVYRHFPLNSIHKNAYSAAKASEAAGDEKFWEMHDRLFATQDEWKNLSDPTEFYVGLAKELGLDEAAFRESLKSDGVAGIVNRDLQLATELSIAATPTFYLNGKKMELVEILNTLRQSTSSPSPEVE
jgi:protein-disulfide isomerase